MLKILRAKLHAIHVTGCALEYHGSVTLDPEVLKICGIYPLEFVYIWNKNTGARLSTYVLTGEAGSRCCILNGAAARTCQVGDALIISAFEYVDDPRTLISRTPKVLTFDADNRITDRLTYAVSPADSWYQLSVSEDPS